MSDDPFHLNRFVSTQAPVYAQVLRELRAGRKATHWMWYVFPQFDGLGESAMAKHYAIKSLEEARAYLAHPLLGPRLRGCVAMVNAVYGRTAEQIFGFPDVLKFHSSVTLFSQAAPDEPAFQQALAKYYAGELDERTLALLKGAA